MKNLSLSITGLVWEGAPTNDPADSDRIFNDIEENAITGVLRFQPQIPNGTTDQAINLPANPSTYLLVFTDQPISTKLNGDSTAVALSPVAAGFKTLVQLVRGPITALTISNASGKTANVDVVILSK